MEAWDSDFAAMAKVLLDEPDVEETLGSIVEYANQTLECDFAGVLLVRARKVIETAAATDPVIERADKLQMECQEGPCLEAIWHHDTIVVDDTRQERRWPIFAPMVAELGLRSILSVRLATSGQTLGALNLYSGTARVFDDDDVAVAQVFAQHASVALATAQKEEGLRRAIDARNLIGQAQGILMERYGLPASKAFAVLRRYSQDNNVKLRQVAERLIATRRMPGDGDH